MDIKKKDFLDFINKWEPEPHDKVEDFKGVDHQKISYEVGEIMYSGVELAFEYMNQIVFLHPDTFDKLKKAGLI